MKAVSLHTAFVSAAPAIFVLLWSTGYVGARFGLPYAEPLTFTSIRFAIVGAIMWLLILIRRAQLPRSLGLWGHLAVSGVLIHTCFIGGVFSAIHLGVDISIAALIAGAQPLLTAIVVVVLFNEALSKRQWTGFVLGFVGLSMVVLKTLQAGALPWSGLIGCMIGLCGMTFGTLYQKRYVVGVDLLAGSAIQFVFALIPCAAWALCFESTAVEWNITFILALTWLCVALSIGAISVLLFLIREGAAARVSSLFYLVPPVTALQGYWLFGERLSLIQLTGIGVAAVGVAMITFDHAKPEQR